MKTLQFGVIGVGRFGKHYVRLLSDYPGVQLKTTANNMAEAKQLLQDPTIDCVIVATPTSSHFELTNEAVNCGKHVLVEKPMVSTVAEARSIQAALIRKPVTFMVGFQYVYNDYIQFLKETIQRNELGKILYVLGEHMYAGPIRADVGCFVDACAHELSILQHLFNPGKVRSTVGQSLAFGGLKHDDFTAATIHFEHGPVTHLVASRFAPQKTRRLTIVGDKAAVVFDDMKIDGKINIFAQAYPSTEGLENTTKSISVGSTPPVVPEIAARESLYNQLEHFIRCVREGRKPVTDIEFGSWVVEQNEAILKSVQKF